MKKTLKLTLILVLMLLLCSFALIGCSNGGGNEDETGKTDISTVSIFLPHVVGGGYITRPGAFEATTREEGYTVTTTWYTVDPSAPSLEYERSVDGETFEVGKMYIASFSFTATTGKLADDLAVKVSYNGETNDAQRDATLGYYFSVYCDGDVSDIYQVNIFLPKVFGGNEITNVGMHDALTRETGYTVKTTWYTVTNPSVQDLQYRKSEEGETFEVGKFYFAAFEFTADDGKIIPDTLLVWVNYDGEQKQGSKDADVGDFFMVYCTESAVEYSDIYQVSISIPKVLGGNYINRDGNHDATTTETGYTVKTTWYTVTNSSISDFQYRKSEEGEKFEEGKFYIADLEFTADDGKPISPDLLVWVNYGDQQIEGSKHELFGNFFMAYCGESIPPEPEINMAKISMRKLYADYGKANTYKATTKDETYTVSTKWYRVTKIAPTYEYVEVTENEYFELGQMYIAQFTFTPVEGVLAKDFNAWVKYEGIENKVFWEDAFGYCYVFSCVDEYIVN